MCRKGLPFIKLGGHEITSRRYSSGASVARGETRFTTFAKKTWLANLMNFQTTHTNKTTRDTF